MQKCRKLSHKLSLSPLFLTSALQRGLLLKEELELRKQNSFKTAHIEQRIDLPGEQLSALLTLSHSERPKLYTILAFLSA